MGCGKTILAARWYWGLLLAGQTGQLLYLCPASIKQQVARELHRRGPPGLRVQILQTSADQLDPTADAIICNYDLLLRDALFEQLLAQPWLLLVLDESHLLRTPTAKRTRRVFGRKPCLAAAAPHVLVMTGTPVVNSPLDLFPMINRLFPYAIAIKDANGKWRRMQLAEFIEKHCTKHIVRIAGGRTIEVVSGGKNLDELSEGLSPYRSRFRRDQVLDLPLLAINDFALTVEIDDAVAAAMAALPSSLVEALQRADDDALVHLLRRYTAELATLRRLLGTLKAKAAAEHILARLNGGEDKIIAFHHHRDVGDIILAQLHDAGVAAALIRGDTLAGARTRTIDALTDGDLQVLLLQAASGSLGLNLQVARRAIIIEPSWTAAEMEQAISRIYRAGQTRNCVVEFLLIPNSLDEHVVGVAHRKAQLAAALIENPQQQGVV
jgi:SNF2 family DNA or RNA helicase